MRAHRRGLTTYAQLRFKGVRPAVFAVLLVALAFGPAPAPAHHVALAPYRQAQYDEGLWSMVSDPDGGIAGPLDTVEKRRIEGGLLAMRGASRVLPRVSTLADLNIGAAPFELSWKINRTSDIRYLVLGGELGLAPTDPDLGAVRWHWRERQYVLGVDGWALEISPSGSTVYEDNFPWCPDDPASSVCASGTVTRAKYDYAVSLSLGYVYVYSEADLGCTYPTGMSGVPCVRVAIRFVNDAAMDSLLEVKVNEPWALQPVDRETDYALPEDLGTSADRELARQALEGVPPSLAQLETEEWLNHEA